MEMAGPGYLSDCLYLVVFSLVYGLSFAMPFWSDENDASNSTSTPTPLHTSPGPLAVTTQSLSAHGHPASLVWRYSWECVGLGVRSVALGLLVTGGVVSVCRLCCNRMHFSPPRAIPALCGITAGVVGTYAELVLWLGVTLLAPNPALTQSQVFCSVTSVFCLVIGIVVYKPRGCSRSSLFDRTESLDDEPRAARRHRHHHFVRLCGSGEDFVIIDYDAASPPPPLQRHPPPPSSPPPSPQPPAPQPEMSQVLVEAEIDVDNVAEQEIHGTDHRSEPSDTEELGNASPSCADYVSADKCSPQDLPEDLRQLSVESLLEGIPKHEGCEAALLDLPKYLGSPAALRDLPKYLGSPAALGDLPRYQSSAAALLELPRQSCGDALLHLPKYQSSTAALLDLPKHESSGGTEPTVLKDVDDALLTTPAGDSGHEDHQPVHVDRLPDHGHDDHLPDHDHDNHLPDHDHDDFDHSIQFIDDDLYYHSSDDDRLETLIQHGNAREQLSGVSESSVTSTTLLIHAGRGLLHPYCDSDEFHSMSDDDTCKNKTWP